MLKKVFIIFITIHSYKISYANPFVQNKYKYFISLERNISSNKLNSLFNKKITDKVFVNEDFSLYFEYGLLDKITIGGKLQNNIFSATDQNDKYYFEKDNYFYNFFIKHQLHNNAKTFSAFSVGYNNKIKYDKRLLRTANNDIYESIFLELSFAFQFENLIQTYDTNILAFTIKYNHQYNSFKDSLKFNINYFYRITSSSLLIFEYSFNKDLYKHFDNKIYSAFDFNKQTKKRLLKYYGLTNIHSFSILSSIEFTDYFSFFTKYGLNLNKNNKVYYNFSLGFWFKNL